MELRATLPARSSPAARARRRGRVIVRTGRQMAKHPRATVRASRIAGKPVAVTGVQMVKHPRIAARGVRTVNWSAVSKAAWTVGGTRRRRRRTAIVIAGVAGTGIAAIVAVRRLSGDQEEPTEGVTGERPRVHTTPQEGHPAGTGERTDRDIGGPTDPDRAPAPDVSGGAPGTPPDSGFEPHRP